jgi:competence protein
VTLDLPDPGAGPGADPDQDGVVLAAATVAGVLLGSRLAFAPAWAAAALCLAAACLATRRPARSRGGAGNGTVAGVMVLGTLVAAGAAVSSLRVTAVRGGMLVGRAGRPGVVELTGTVAEKPRRLRYGGHWAVLTIDRVDVDGRPWRTRERAGVVLPGRAAATGRLGAATGRAGAATGRLSTATRRLSTATGRAGAAAPSPEVDGQELAVGDRLWVRAGIGKARWADPLGRRPPVVLRHPVVRARAPAGSAALRASEMVRAEARRRALRSLDPERAGLLVGMALGDTSLLPGELERDFRAAGLTHLTAVSGANLAVVLAADSGWPVRPGPAAGPWPRWGSCSSWCWLSSPAGSRACCGPA